MSDSICVRRGIELCETDCRIARCCDSFQNGCLPSVSAVYGRSDSDGFFSSGPLRYSLYWFFFFFFTSLKLLQTQRRFFLSSFIKDLRSWCCWLLGEMMKMSSYNRTSLRDDDPLENYLKRCCCKIMFWLLVTLESWCQCHFGQLLMVKNQKSGRKIRGKCCKCV